MQRLKSSVSYTIATTDPTALAAIHKFLRFQIEDHQTGGPIKVENLK